MRMLHRARTEVRFLGGRSAAFSRLLLKGGIFPSQETEICIEGFQRSGNTFAVIAFQSAQLRWVNIAHHIHAPAAVIAAVRMDIPVLVLLRPPEETVLSCTIRWPHLSIRQVVRGYVRFHGPLVRYRDQFAVGRFEDVIGDFGKVVRDVNIRFGTSFQEFVHTEENVRSVIETLDEWDRNALSPGEHRERGRARPSAWREPMKAALIGHYRSPALRRLRTRAELAYEALGSRPAGG